MTPQTILAAFDAEAARLVEIAAGIDDTAFARPSPCPPWTVAELFCHLRMATARVSGMLAEPAPAGGPLVPARGYYRAGQRFSAATNDERVESARRDARSLDGAAARVRDFDETRERIGALLRSAPPERVVRTRHGDRMLLVEFTRTRVLELAVHGLDLAAGLGRPPWMTPQAALVTGELLLPPAKAAELRKAAGWDQVTLVAKLTGRVPATPAETRLIDTLGIERIALGQPGTDAPGQTTGR